MRKALQEILPTITRKLEYVVVVVELVDDPTNDGVEQVLTPAHVPIERHGLNVKGVADPPHRQRCQPLDIDELNRRGNHPLTAQRLPARRRLKTRDHSRVSVKALPALIVWPLVTSALSTFTLAVTRLVRVLTGLVLTGHIHLSRCSAHWVPVHQH